MMKARILVSWTVAIMVVNVSALRAQASLVSCESEKAAILTEYDDLITKMDSDWSLQTEPYRLKTERIVTAANQLLDSISDEDRKTFANAGLYEAKFRTEAARLAEQKLLTIKQEFDDIGCPSGYRLAESKFYRKHNLSSTGKTYCQKGDGYMEKYEAFVLWQPRRWATVAENRVHFSDSGLTYRLTWSDLAVAHVVTSTDVLEQIFEKRDRPTSADYLRAYLPDECINKQ